MAPAAATADPADEPAESRAREKFTTLPLSASAAAFTAYAAGWLSGLLVLMLEGERLAVRRHAAQSLVAFGLFTLLTLLLLLLAGFGLFISIALFRGLLWAAQAVIAIGALCWLWALVQAARGRDWSWPLIGGWVERLARLGR